MLFVSRHYSSLSLLSLLLLLDLPLYVAELRVGIKQTSWF
jgi:hypothetical protein